MLIFLLLLFNIISASDRPAIMTDAALESQLNGMLHLLDDRDRILSMHNQIVDPGSDAILYAYRDLSPEDALEFRAAVMARLNQGLPFRTLGVPREQQPEVILNFIIEIAEDLLPQVDVIRFNFLSNVINPDGLDEFFPENPVPYQGTPLGNPIVEPTINSPLSVNEDPYLEGSLANAVMNIFPPQYNQNIGQNFNTPPAFVQRLFNVAQRVHDNPPRQNERQQALDVRHALRNILHAQQPHPDLQIPRRGPVMSPLLRQEGLIPANALTTPENRRSVARRLAPSSPLQEEVEPNTPEDNRHRRSEDSPEGQRPRQRRRLNDSYDDTPGNRINYDRYDDRNDPDGGGIPVN